MAIIKKSAIISLLIFGTMSVTSDRDATAASTPKLNLTSETLTITVKDRGNKYAKSTLKVSNNKEFSISKITYKSKNAKIAKVSKKGIVTAQSPGNTKITVAIKYKNKSTKNKKLKEKKITVSIKVKAKYKSEIPQTGMQYDEEGRAKPIYPFTSGDDDKGHYSNDASYVDRFPVYVETDYDTDQDGKRDLVMAYVQVPRSAVDGYYQAPVLMVANPYLVEGHRDGASVVELLKKTKKNSFDYSLLTSSPEKRVWKSEVTTREASDAASEWVDSLKSNEYNMRNLKEFDYYIARGYAYVVSPGLGGAKECEGLQCCGEKVEASAYAAIIEWLHGDRNGYADKKGKKLLRADWCNGHTAMTGLSYTGTLAYEVATIGVEGLDTVIPCGSIASWYDYANSQGASIIGTSTYMSWLGDSCAKRYMYSTKKEEDKDKCFSVYKKYLYQKNYDEVMAAGSYTDYWDRFNYSKGKPMVPALLVEGLNDANVKSKQTAMMRDVFVKAGCPCKVILHQGRHDMLSDEYGVIKVNGEYYDDLINRWLAYYMAGVDNGIDEMKDYTVQSNIDGSWETYDEGRETENLILEPSGKENETKVSFNSEKLEKQKGNWEDYQRKTKGLHALWEKKMDEDLTLSGVGTIHLRVKMPNTQKNNPVMVPILFDESDEKFEAYVPDSEYNTGYYGAVKYNYDVVVDKYEPYNRYEVEFDRALVNEKYICAGAINLRMPDAGWEPETCKEPETPIQNDTYYDYTVYLPPTKYTVKKGHKLCLYFVPYGDCMSGEGVTFEFVDRYMSEGIGYYSTMASKYEFTIDNKNSYAVLPIATDNKD